jgi:hypothetical protein
MSKYWLRKPLKNIGVMVGEQVEIGEGDCILLDDAELREFSFASYFEKVPEPKVVELVTRQWEGSSRVYIGIQFPSRCNMIWVDEKEIDQLQDAIISHKTKEREN